MDAATASAQVRWGVVDVAPAKWRQVLQVLANAPGDRTVAVMQSDANELVALSRQFDIPAIYLHAGDLFSDPAVEAVYIGSTVTQRAQLVAQALAAGKHVLVEAPVAISVAAFTQVMQAARRQPELVAAVAMPQRNGAALRAARELVLAGELGQIVHARAILAERDGGAMSSPPDADRLTAGLVWDLGYRCLAAVTGLVDAVPVAVSATIEPGRGQHRTGSALLAFTLPDGVQVSIECLHLPPAGVVIDRLELHGTRGSIILEDAVRTGVTARLLRQRRRPESAGRTEEPNTVAVETVEFAAVDQVAAEVAVIADALDGSGSELVPLARARAMTAALEAALSSAREGRRVPVDLTRAGESL